MTEINVNNYLLDDEQTKPIIENPKYSIIIAGAGSGKSLTLVGKIKYLLENKIYQPSEICCISFTNEATEKLKKDIFKNTNQEVPTFTFHKLALSILKKEKATFSIAPVNLLEQVIDTFFDTNCQENQNLINSTYKTFHHLFKTKENWLKIIQSKELKNFKKTIITFINLFKCNDFSIDNFIIYLKEQKERNSLLIIYAIYLIYENEKKSAGLLDFDDLIIKATGMLQEKDCRLPYKIIIIDEFQDTSLCRFHLIEEIIKQNDASLCVVGDDYQSIYHFSGCDLKLFLDFETIFPNTKVYKLQKTYRNSQELISIAGDFIKKNPQQIKKELISDKHIGKPIKLVYYSNQDKVLEKVLKKLPENKSILILGRNNFDLQKYTKKLHFEMNESNNLKFERFPNHTLRYLTIHQSKGLESDKVILLNVANDIYGIPSLKEEEGILKHVKKGFYYPYEEERRLFYVALTRTKEEIYLLIPRKNPSRFIKEIIKKKHIEKISL